MTTEHQLTHIHLGPDAGHNGDRIVFEGTPADLVAARSHPHHRLAQPAHAGSNLREVVKRANVA